MIVVFRSQVADESAVINSRQTNSSPDLTNTIRSFAKEKVGNAETNSSAANGTAEPQHGNSPQTRSACSRAITCTGKSQKVYTQLDQVKKPKNTIRCILLEIYFSLIRRSG